MDIYSQLFTSLREDLAVDHNLSECINAPVRLDPLYVARAAMAESFYKKLQPLKADKQLERVAIDGFKAANAHCANWSVSFDDDFIHRCRVQAMKDLTCLRDWTWQDYLDNSGLIPGPGASLFSKGQNSYLEKLFINRLVTTNASLHCELMRFYARKNRALLKAEQQRQTLTSEVYTLVNYSRLGVVRKNAKTDRTICTEPCLNMLFQRALGEGINHALKVHYGYDESFQPDRNRELARQGSMYGILSTIDLSSASDTISLNFCREVLPSWIFAAIEDCRSEFTSYNGEVIPLAMVSSMGNGFTFPLETYIFSLITRVCAAECGLPFKRYDASVSDTGNYGVFGDDIICPTSMFDRLCSRLIHCGFIPNKDKSFSSGFFRESCGSDYYDGYNVRGVYIKRIDRLQDRFSAFNRLQFWSLKHNFMLYRTLADLLSKDWRRCVIPTSDSDIAGYKVPVCYAPRSGPYGWKYRKLQAVKPFVHVFRKEVRVDDPLSRDFEPKYNNFYGFLFSVLPQVSRIPKLLDHLYPEAWSDRSRIDRRDDERSKCRWERSRICVWDDLTCTRTAGFTNRYWVESFESLLIWQSHYSANC
jgi:hypothetical protein